MAIDCGCEARSARLRSLAVLLRNANDSGHAPEQRRDLARKLQALSARDWDEEPGPLAQALDSVLDEALDAFSSDQPAQGVALVVGACATVDSLLEALGVSDPDEPVDDPPATQPGMGGGGGSYSAPVAAGAEERAWDGPAAMSRCAKSSTPASCYASICAGRRSGPADQQSSWALPHHDRAGGPANQAGVSAALGRVDQTDGINKAAARTHLLDHQKSSKSARFQPPREQLYRGVLPIELRDGSGSGWAPVMAGHWAVFNQWTRIDSLWEGEFMESLFPGCFRKTFQENGPNIQVLFQHGRDFSIGSKVLGAPEVQEEDGEGAYSEVPLFDTSYNRDLLPALIAGRYGASFRFQVMQEEVTEEPGRSAWNPDGIPERVIKEARVIEYGPVTFPAYQNAKMTVGDRRMKAYRSLSDFFLPTELREEHSHDHVDEEHEELHRELARERPAPPAALPPLEEWLESQRTGGLRVRQP